MRIPNLGEITIIRPFSQPSEKIWQAWTDPEYVKLWFGSDPNGKVLHASLDVRIGGSFEVSFINSDMQGYTCYGTYKEVEPDQKLRFTWGWKEQPEIEELVTVLLRSTPNGTDMEFIHGHIDPRTAHDYEAGWNSTFDKLEKAITNLRASS